ncbi:MAG TPA: Lrp/AsnC family transcriptional regulator [Candidatus Thermoplasmatota archaeon]|nr:Lrp/AsnC family transcriptional regulator [Candidatus Thermoplasmatota archaeon]
MDALDIRILRTMGIQPYSSAPRDPANLRPGRLAKQLGVTKKTVAERIVRMEQDKLIGGYELYPNFRHLGYEASCYNLDLDDEEVATQALESLKAEPGFVAIYTFVGGPMCAMVAYRDPAEQEALLRRLMKVAGEGGAQKFYDLAMPQVVRPLSSLDWRILQGLRGNAKRPLSEVARELKVSARTVKRRFERMGAEGSFLITPMLDPSVAEGLMMFVLLFHLDADAGPKAYNAARKAFDGQTIAVDFAANPSMGSFALVLFARSMAEAKALERKARAVPGVAKVQPFFFTGAAESFAWVDEAIAERVEAAGT